MSTVVLQSACKTCNLYIVLQRRAHRNASRLSDTAAGKIMSISEFYFELKRKSPLPSTVTKDTLVDLLAVLDGLKDNPTLNALKPVYEKLDGWFVSSLPGFVPVGVDDKSRTDNEHNKRMLRTNEDLRTNYRVRGNELMDENKLKFKDYEEKKSELTHAYMELRLQLESDKLTVDNAQNVDFETLVSSIKGANGGSTFLGQTVKTIAFIDNLTKLTVA